MFFVPNYFLFMMWEMGNRLSVNCSLFSVVRSWDTYAHNLTYLYAFTPNFNRTCSIARRLLTFQRSMNAHTHAVQSTIILGYFYAWIFNCNICARTTRHYSIRFLSRFFSEFKIMQLLIEFQFWCGYFFCF